jgi:hypothetical protein
MMQPDGDSSCDAVAILSARCRATSTKPGCAWWKSTPRGRSETGASGFYTGAPVRSLLFDLSNFEICLFNVAELFGFRFALDTGATN